MFIDLVDGQVLGRDTRLSLSFDPSLGYGVKDSLLDIVVDVVIVSFNEKSVYRL